jgi:hypothetical protein
MCLLECTKNLDDWSTCPFPRNHHFHRAECPAFQCTWEYAQPQLFWGHLPCRPFLVLYWQAHIVSPPRLRGSTYMVYESPLAVSLNLVHHELRIAHTCLYPFETDIRQSHVSACRFWVKCLRFPAAPHKPCRSLRCACMLGSQDLAGSAYTRHDIILEPTAEYLALDDVSRLQCREIIKPSPL